MKINMLVFSLLLISFIGYAQNIPTYKVVEIENLSKLLDEKVQNELKVDGKISTKNLANYFRDKFSERYFYKWENFEERFNKYKEIYPAQEASHTEKALDHISKYSDSTQWVLPFNYLNGEAVNAYAIRHLARQHKMVDIAFYYHYANQNPAYISYFVNQLKSLNVALDSDEYESIEDGNGIYEVFRSGYRILNWLQIHSIFLDQDQYSDEDQLWTIATLLQHASNLYVENPEFRDGNHQTRGMSALAMISILLRDFVDTDEWFSHSMTLLEEHLAKEINEDGFQFERSVHYHISDIENYFYVYQLAKISGIEVSDFWEKKLKSLFVTLTKIGYPDKSAPVLQDDTENPWAEKNNISNALTLGYLLFGDAEMGYFANQFVNAKMFWYLSDKQLKSLNSIKRKQPEFNSISFPETGYYVMREGWESKDKMMIISAGVDEKKPDHQHGDILGIQAMFNGKVLLPNYQVRYSLEDLELFKNSIVKNVALVDNELQGKGYRSNKGGSGFGKFANLPQANVITWSSNDKFDLFVGSHDGFENIGVAYSRQVIYVKDDFWIVKDNFNSESKHNYKQIWQGHYSLENQPNLIRATFDDATACDIYQLVKTDVAISSGARGKEWTIVSKNDQYNFNFISLVFPYIGYDNRINELDEKPDLKAWEINNSEFEIFSKEAISLSKNKETYLFGVKKILYKGISMEFTHPADLYLHEDGGGLSVYYIGVKDIKFALKGVKTVSLNSQSMNNSFIISAGDHIKVDL